MNVAAYVSVAIGYVAGIVAVFLVARHIVAAIVRSAPLQAGQRRTIVRLAAAGGFVALIPALLLGTVIGATLGGTYGGQLLGAIGAPGSGEVLGIGLGMFAVVALVMCAAIAAGAWIGKLIAGGNSVAS